MNAKKYRRRAPKLTQKIDKGSQHRKTLEGKSNVAAKRVTLLPGFLINGFASNTVKKSKVLEQPRKRKTHLHENLQSFLAQKGKNLRRSQRILKRNVEQYCVANGSDGSSVSNNFNDTIPSPLLNVPSQNVKNMTNNISFKSILKNGSKSLFKDISERFSKVKIQNTEAVSQKPVCIEEHQNTNENFGFHEQISYHLNEHSEYFNQKTNYIPQDQHDVFRIDLNESFCENLGKQICVTFKRKVVDECRENIKKQIKTVNMVLEGKVKLDEMIVNGSEENQPSGESKDSLAPKFFPVSAQNWAYNTPPNQKIGMPQLEECQLQAGVLHHNKNEQNLYEVKPNFNVNFTTLEDVESVPIDERFFKRVAHVKKTPANFGFRGFKEGNDTKNIFHRPWNDSVGCGSSTGRSDRKDSFVNPNFVNIMTHPIKVPRNPVFPDYLQEDMPTPKLQGNSNELPDFTFIKEGDDFKIQETQPTTDSSRRKRRLSEEDFGIKRRSLFATEQNKSKENRMFNFGSQEGKMFNFGKV